MKDFKILRTANIYKVFFYEFESRQTPKERIFMSHSEKPIGKRMKEETKLPSSDTQTEIDSLVSFRENQYKICSFA